MDAAALVGLLRNTVLPGLPRGAHVRQAMRDRLAEHRAYVERHGEDLPEVRDWVWRG